MYQMLFSVLLATLWNALFKNALNNKKLHNLLALTTYKHITQTK